MNSAFYAFERIKLTLNEEQRSELVSDISQVDAFFNQARMKGLL